MKYLFLAEKPSTMKAIKDVYEKSNKPLGQIDFFALAGHVCKLCEPKSYKEWDVKWDERQLPMIPQEFKVGALREDVINKLKKQISSIKYDAIIVGTDSDVEGNGIYDLLESYLGLQNYKTYRFFESDLTPVGIMRSINSLQDYHTNPRDVGMTEAYRIRSRFDWLIGFNMSVAYTVKSGFLMKVGRVKAPTLKLVYDNCKAIDNFSSKTSYQPSIKTKGEEITAGLVDEFEKAIAFPNKIEAEDVLKKLSGTVTVKSYKKEIKKTQPNQLYKLTDIQYEAGVKYGYTPEKTLELIQSLYETHKIISYPRTDGRFVSSEKAKDFPKLLNAIKEFPGLKEFVENISESNIAAAQKNSRYVNDKKVQESSHDALIPTGVTYNYGKLKQDERNICDMIFRRFIGIFLPALEEEKTKLILEDNGYLFSCNGSKVVNAGFTVLLRRPIENIVPNFIEGKVLEEKETFVHEVVSKPPQRFTQATLIKAMENIQKYVNETDLKNAIKKAGGIGQPSSRAAIISELVSSGYIKDEKKGLYMTDKGRKYIENLGNSSLVSPKLSAEWEMHINDIKNGDVTYEEIYLQILNYLRDALKEIDNLEIEKSFDLTNRKEIGKCPICGKPVIEFLKGYGCTGYPDCKFSIPKIIAGKELSEKNIKDLINKGTTGRVSGFISKLGRPFASTLVIKDGHLQWEPFEQNTEMKCPKCGRNLIKTPMTYKCSDTECRFTLWLSIAGKILSDKNVEDLLNGRQTDLIKGMKNKNGESFDAKLKIDNGTLKFISNKSECKNTGIQCPICGHNIMEKANIYVCENNDCEFHIFKRISGVKITSEMIKEVIEKGQTNKAYNFTGRDRKNFKAYLAFDNDKKNIRYIYA